MKSKQFSFRFITILTCILAIHSGLVFFKVFDVNFNQFISLEIVLLAIYTLGIIVIAPGLDKDPENFVGRFLILTTVQLLAAMSVLAALAYVKSPQMRELSLHFISAFVIVLGVQSFLLVKWVNKSK